MRADIATLKEAATMWKLIVLAVAAAILLAVQTKLTALIFFAVLVGVFLHGVFASTEASRGPSV